MFHLSQVAVSIFTIIIRRHYFKQRFEYMIQTRTHRGKGAQEDLERRPGKSVSIQSRSHLIRRVDTPVGVNRLNNGGHLLGMTAFPVHELPA
jgi:hypothetical protein